MALVPSPEANYRNLFQAFSKMIWTEHPRVLFRGIGVVASGAGPAHALYFSCYEFSKKALTRTNTQSTVLAQGEHSLCLCRVVHSCVYRLVPLFLFWVHCFISLFLVVYPFPGITFIKIYIVGMWNKNYYFIQ